MTHKIGPKGQVVIPKEIRDALGLRPGSPVDFAKGDGEVRIRPHRSGRSLGGSLRGGPNMASELLKDRAREPK